jgi:hypothetical protein
MLSIERLAVLYCTRDALRERRVPTESSSAVVCNENSELQATHDKLQLNMFSTDGYSGR